MDQGEGMVLGMIQVHCTYCALSFCYWIGSTSDHQALEFGGWGHWITGICLFIQNTYILYSRDWWQSKLDSCPVFNNGAPLQWTQSPHSQTFGKHCAGTLNLWLGRTPPTIAPKNTHRERQTERSSRVNEHEHLVSASPTMPSTWTVLGVTSNWLPCCCCCCLVT